MPTEQTPTGWPPGLLQDDSRALSKALAGMPDAMRHAREAAAAINAPTEQTDIVERLRACAPEGLLAVHVSDLAALREAADTIARLRAENEALRAATLEEAATVADELREHYAAIKDTALLNGDVELSNAASGEPRACEAIADILRSEAAKLKG